MSDLATPSAFKAACSIGLAGCLTGADLFALVGAFAGVLLAMTKQEPVSVRRLVAISFSIIVFAVGGTWFIAEAIPVATNYFGLAHFELIRGRLLVAWLLAYFMQDVLIPGIGGALDRLLGWIGRRP